MPAVFSNEQDKPTDLSAQEITPEMKAFEAKQNLVGFFSLLLKIDKRLHPENYKSQTTQK